MRRAALVIVFITALLLVVVSGHAYLTDKLVVAPDLSPGLRALLVLIIGGGALALMMQPLAERGMPPRVARCITWPASIWMGAAFFLLLGFLLTDLVRALVGAAFAAGGEGAAIGAAGVGAARLQAIVVVGLAVAAVARGVHELRGGPRVTRHEVRLARWPRALDGFRIVQITDIHIGPILDRRFAAAVTAQVNALAPDLVAITGDLVDGDARRLRAEVAPFAELRAPQGVWFVTGNHDYFSGVEAWVANVRRLGIRPLRNERVTIERNGAAFDLAGVEDHHAYMVHPTEKSDVVRALADRDPERAVVLLAHDPLTFKTAARCGVDLQISGHTHGGQIWPFNYLVRLTTPFVAGHYRRGDAQLFVSRGTGFWGPAMRLFAPAEIAEITIRSAAPSDA